MADVDISLEIEAKKAKKNLDKINKELKDTGKNAKKAGDSIEKSFKVSSGAIAAAGAAVVALGAGFTFAINEASKLQDLETQFISFTGSAEGAADQVERIAEFSGQTPFKLEELANANRTLLAFGSSTEESFVQLKQLGEVAAATGQNIGDLTQIFGQIQVAGKLTGERFNQLAERSVNLGPVLAESLGVAETEIRGLISAGKISSEEVAKAFETMTTGAGQFAGGMERLSKTFSGAKSTLSDNIDLLAASIGKILLPLAVSLVEEFTNAVKVTNAFVKSFEDASKTDLDKRIESTKDNLADLVDELREAKEDGKGFFESQEEYEAGLRRTEQAIRDTTATLKKLNAAKRVEAETGIGKKTEAEEETETQFDQSIIDKAQEIDQKLIALSEQYYANRNARAKTQNEEEIAILDERFAQVQEKLVEQQATRLELLGEFDEAEKLQVQAKLQAIEDAENAQIERRKTAAAKARKDEINFDKITTKAKLKFEEQTWAERAKTSQAGLSALASIQRTGSKEAFEIGKAASIAQALVSIPSTAIKAYESLAGIPYVGPALGAAAAAAAIAAGTARINQIRSQKITGMQDGGLVEGGIPGVDSVPILAQRGEVVVPRKDFADLNFNNDNQVILLKEIRELLNIISTNTLETNDPEQSPQNVNIELTLNGEVLANQILELNQDNARIA